MNAWTIFFICAISFNCLSVDVDSIRDSLRIGSDGKRTFVFTNETSAPFYIIPKDLDFRSMIGGKLDTLAINSSNFVLSTQYNPTAKTVQGRPTASGVWRYSGRYALLTGRVLDFVDFKMDVSDEPDSRGEVLSVTSEILSICAPDSVIAEAEKLRSESGNLLPSKKSGQVPTHR